MIYKQLEENSELIKKFKLRTRHFTIKDLSGKLVKMVVTAGTEVIGTARTKHDIEQLLLKSGGITNSTLCEEVGILPYRYTDTPFNIDKLKELVKYKSIKSLSKDDALKINSYIKGKQELEDKLVYITDDNPSTNSLAIAKQFNLEHRNVILKLFELGSMYPSVLMKIKPDVYSDILRGGGDTTKSTSTKLELSAEYSALSNTRKRYEIFYHIPEDVYYQFVKKIGTPKGLDTDKGMAKLIFIESKQDEYFNAFKNLRESLKDSGIKKDEIEAMIKIRTKNTSLLMSEVYNFVTGNNEDNDTKDINLINANRFVFNIVNHLVGINAINYKPTTDEELKNGATRQTKDEFIQEQITRVEHRIIMALQMAKKHDLPFVEAVLSASEKSEEQVKSILKDYDVLWLFDSVSNR